MGRSSSSSGRKRAAVLGFLGLTAPETTGTTTDEQAGAWQRGQQHQQHHQRRQGAAAAPWTRAPPSSSSASDDEDDIDLRASEFIDKVHRRMLLAGDDDAAPWSRS